MKKCLAILILATLAFIAYTAFSIALYANIDRKKPADVAIILGAAAWYKRPSPVFEERIRHGIWLYQNGYVKKLILTGGKSKNAPFSEAWVARRYAIQHGVPADDIDIEEASLTTRENLINAKALMKKNGYTTVLIVSDPLHMRRAITIANNLNLDASPSPTPTTRYASLSAKIAFLAQETWHMIGYHIYPNGLPERPAGSNASP